MFHYVPLNDQRNLQSFRCIRWGLRAASYTGSPAKQERSTADQTDQRAEKKTNWSTGLITLRTEELESQHDEEVRSQDEANDGEENSNKEHGKNAKKNREYSINHFHFSSNNCQFQ
jgi:DNA-directed RNA polymerase delta subunit